MIRVTINGVAHEAMSGERLIDIINRIGTKISQVCYHPQLGPIQTCDTCMVETNGKLVRACATNASAGMEIFTKSEKAVAAQRDAFNRILSNHVLYCTVCDNNNGNCTIHNTEKLLESNIRQFHITQSPTKRITPTPFTATTRSNAFCVGDAWKPAKTCR